MRIREISEYRVLYTRKTNPAKQRRAQPFVPQGKRAAPYEQTTKERAVRIGDPSV